MLSDPIATRHNYKIHFLTRPQRMALPPVALCNAAQYTMGLLCSPLEIFFREIEMKNE